MIWSQTHQLSRTQPLSLFTTLFSSTDPRSSTSWLPLSSVLVLLIESQCTPIVSCSSFGVFQPLHFISLTLLLSLPLSFSAMLVLSLSVLSLFSLYFLFVPSGFFFDLLGLVEFPRSFHYALFFFVVLNTLLAFLFESYAAVPTTKALKAVQRTIKHARGGSKRATRHKEGRIYKMVAQQMINEEA